MIKPTVRDRVTAIQARIEQIIEERDEMTELASHYASRHFREGLSEERIIEQSATIEEFSRRLAQALSDGNPRLDTLSAEAAALPTSTRQRWYRPLPFRVGFYGHPDTFTRLESTAELIDLVSYNRDAELTKVDFVIIETSSAHKNPLDPKEPFAELPAPLLTQLRERHTPVVLLDEHGDLPDSCVTEQFKGIRFTAITPAAGVLSPAIASLLGDDGLLPAGVDHRMFNPLGSMRHQELDIIAATPWSSESIPAEMRPILDGLHNASVPLYIMDINADGQRRHQLRHPDRYINHLHPSVSPSKFSRLTRVAPITVIQSSDSRDLHAPSRGIFDLQAAGSMVLTGYNAEINSHLPHVAMPSSRSESESLALSLDRIAITHAQVAGVRSAFTANSSFDLMRVLATAAGAQYNDLDSDAPSVFVAAASKQEFDEFVSNQVFEGDLTFVASSDLNHHVGSGAGDVLITIGSTREQSPHLIQDLVNGFKFADVDQVIPVDPLDERTDIRPYEFTRPKVHARGPVATWVHATSTLADAAGRAATAITVAHEPPRGRSRETSVDARMSVVVPVYNNGRHLQDKCFASLRRSSIFDQMQILLIDDGSTDAETRYILRDLEQTYANVEVFSFEPGGSGSASRPRNKGLELARAPLVTYLDPDNEAVNDGYARLAELVERDELHFAIGNMVQLRERALPVRNERILAPFIDDKGNVQPNALVETNFQPMSIQALVADTKWLRSLGLVQPVGAVGQDSYFFQQMLHYARKVRAIPLTIHLYYAAVSGSTVNAISPRFFKNYIPLDTARASWLRSEGLLEAYNERRLEKFTKSWHLQKLAYVSDSEKQESLEIIHQLASLYGHTDWKDADLAKLFGSGMNVSSKDNSPQV